MLITKDMGIMEIVQKYPATVEVLQRFGMGCIGCAAAHFENIEQGALAHGIDVPRLMEALNGTLKQKSAFLRFTATSPSALLAGKPVFPPGKG